MALQLAPEEPEAGPWRVEHLGVAIRTLTSQQSDRDDTCRPAVVAIDGRSNNGKTTLATRIRDRVPGSVLIHTDDIAFQHSRFGWADLLIDGILVPPCVRAGPSVTGRRDGTTMIEKDLLTFPRAASS
jgi:hypothetical protein